MDASAINELQQSELIKSANLQISSDLRDTLLALPENFKLHDLEKSHSARTRFRGSFSTNSIDAFAEYANEHVVEGTPCFIDAKAMNAKLIFNYVEAGHCDNTSFLSLEKTAAYEALLKISGARLAQKEVAEFIEDWRSCLTARSEPTAESPLGDSIPIVRAIGAIRKISIEAIAKSESEVRNFGASTASMESIDVKSADLPPAFFSFTCEPYHGLSVRTFDLRLSVITDRAPALILRIVREQEVAELMAKEFKAIIEEKLKGSEQKINTFIGKFSA